MKIGVVEDINDLKKIARIRIRVESIHGTIDEVPTEHLPWALPKYVDTNKHDLPPLGSEVCIEFVNNDICRPLWYTRKMITENNFELSDSDYPSAIVMHNKQLSQYDSVGAIDIRFTESQGYLISINLDNDTPSIINIRRDGSIILTNSVTGKHIHVSNESISLGSETKSSESGVLGEQNEIALNKINTYFNELVTNINTNLTKLNTVAQSNPYTSPLAAPIKLFANEIKQLSDNLNKDLGEHIPKTKSTIVSLD